MNNERATALELAVKFHKGDPTFALAVKRLTTPPDGQKDSPLND